MIEWAEVIGTYGFPITLCIYLLWERTHVLTDIAEKQKVTSEALTLAVHELTIVIKERIK